MVGYLRISQTAARPIDEVFATAGRLDEYRPYQRSPGGRGARACSRAPCQVQAPADAHCPSGSGRAPHPSGLDITAPLRWHLVARQGSQVTDAMPASSANSAPEAITSEVFRPL